MDTTRFDSPAPSGQEDQKPLRNQGLSFCVVLYSPIWYVEIQWFWGLIMGCGASFVDLKPQKLKRLLLRKTALRV